MVPGELADFSSTFTSPVFELFLSEVSVSFFVKKKKKKESFWPCLLVLQMHK